MSTQQKVTLVIVNYNSTEFLKKLLKSIQKIKQIIGEVIIIDNHSKNFASQEPGIINTVKKTKILIIKNHKNKGFATAVNQGIKKSKYKYVLLLNPDCLIIDKSIKHILKAIENNPKIGAIGGQIKGFNSKEKKLSATQKINFLVGLFEFSILKKIFPNNPISQNFWIEKKLKPKKPIEVDTLCGAFILFRKKIKKQTIYLDKKFFLYLEDIDLCLRIKHKGYKIIFDPKAKIKHRGGGSNQSKYKTVLKHWYKSRKYLFKKYLTPMESIILNIFFTLEEKLLYLYHYLKNEPTE